VENRGIVRAVPVVIALLAVPAAARAGQGAEAPAATLQGQVIEAFSGRPLPGATVSAAGVTASTDARGRFTLRLPPGSWTVDTRADGHLGDEQLVALEAGADRRLDVYLIDRRKLREEVTVEGTAGEAEDGPAALPLRPAAVLTVAGAADNVFRTLQTLPGVAGVEDFGSRLAVRGGSPDQNLTVMDGVEIHNPYRLFGLTSAFNPETIRSFELSAGAFPARYGDRLSSLLVVENRDGDDARRIRGTSSLSLTDANVVFEGALPRDAAGSWLLTGRRTYYDLVANRIVDTDLPAFADLQARATWAPRPGLRLSVFGLRSRESADARFEGDRPGEQGTFVTGARHDLFALRLFGALGARGSSRTSLSWYRNTDAVDVDARFRDEARRSNSPTDAVAFSDADVAFTRDLTVRDLALRQELGWAASGRHLLQAGLEAHGLDTGVGWRIAGDRNRTQANGSSVRGGTGLPGVLDSSRASVRGGAWVEDRFHMMRRLTVEPGLRLDAAGVNRKTALSPRLRATLHLGERTRLLAGTGLFTQSPGYEKLVQSDYFLDLSRAGTLPLDSERSVHAVLGLERDLAPGLLARVEGYFKTFDRLIVGRLETEAERSARVAGYDFPADLRPSVPGAAQITTEPVNGGRGAAYGFDVYVARRPIAVDTRLTGWASYTYGVARRDLYGRRLPFEYDRRHALSAVAAFRAGGKVELSATARVASGFPYTPIRGLRVSAVADAADADGDGSRLELRPERDAEGRLVYTSDRGGVSNLGSARLPVFARVDFRASLRPKGAGGRWLFYVDVINLLDRDNVGAYQESLVYDPSSDRPRLVLEPGQGVPFLPSLGVRFRF
jgi:hypothetical protein